MKKGNSKLFYSIFLSYLLILLVPIAGMITYCTYSAGKMKEELLASQQGLLSRVQSEMDLRFESIYKVNDLLATSTDVQIVADNHADENTRELFDTMEVQSLLRNTQVTLDSYDTFIFFKENSSVLSIYRRYRKEYLDLYAKQYGMTVDQFIETMQTSSYREHKIIGAGTSYAKLLFMRAIYAGKKNLGSVVTVVPLESVASLLESSDWLSGTDCYLLSSSDSILIGASNDTPVLSYDDFSETEQLISKKVNGTWIYSSCIDSTLGNWRYCVSTPKAVVMKKLNAIYIFIFADLMLSLGIGFALTVYMSKRQYSPIEKISGSISRNLKQYGSLSAFSEVVEKVVSALREENTRNERRLYQQEGTLRNEELGEVLRGNKNGEKALEILQRWQPRFTSEGFGIIIFQPGEYQNSIFSEAIGEEAMRTVSYDLLYFSCENVISELLFAEENNWYGALTRINDMIIAIVQSKENPRDSLIQAELLPVLEKIVKVHRDIFKLQLYISASTTGTFDLNHLPERYCAALRLSEMKQFWGNEIGNIVFSGTTPQKSQTRSETRIQVRKLLLNFLMARDFKSARGLISEELSQDFSRDVESFARTRSYITGLVGMVCDAVADSGSEEGDEFFHSLFIDNRLLSAQSIQALRDETLSLLDQIIAYQEQKESPKQPAWLESVTAYIEENYVSTALDVSMIAEKYTLNVSYLSRTFKKYMDCGILEYIHKVRLSHAKKMLLAGVSVRETAEKCGYIDSKALIRAFKRYEGITPGQWSEIQS